jgi:2-dehydro-3-deoxyphosphooctonate aldolase (KDO 8-P synthase)
MPIAAREIRISPTVKVGGAGRLFLIAGPCVIESRKHSFTIARKIQGICRTLNIPFIFKASFDKANRSSLKSYRGPGIEKGLEILGEIKGELGLPVLSDVHETWHVEKAAAVLDVIQIPAFLCRQTDLIVEAGRTQKPVNIKKGQFLSPPEMKNVIEKLESVGNHKIILTERGSLFGYNNLVFDVRSIPIMKGWGYPVVIDASHSVQKPGGQGATSGGEHEFIPSIAKAGVSVGADGLFLEVHEDPRKALSDRYNSLKINELVNLLKTLVRLKQVV